MTSLKPFSIAFDAWRVARGFPEMLVVAISNGYLNKGWRRW
jgi:hypothetical protein